MKLTDKTPAAAEAASPRDGLCNSRPVILFGALLAYTILIGLVLLLRGPKTVALPDQGLAAPTQSFITRAGVGVRVQPPQQMGKHVASTANPAPSGVAQQDKGHVIPMSCTSFEHRKQSCVFEGVCLHITADRRISATLGTGAQPAHATDLRRHLANIWRGAIDVTNITVTINTTGNSSSSFMAPPTILWRAEHGNQDSFGHAMINEAFPMFLVLHNHFQHIPDDLRLLVAGGWHPVLRHVLSGCITGDSADVDTLRASTTPTCFRQLVVGDGGYVAASRASLAKAGTPTPFGREPSFFSSINWRNFRQHAMKINGIYEQQTTKPLILLNDKRYGADNKEDRRMLLDIDALAGNLSALYPAAEVKAVRFRDLNMTEQIRWVSRANVFITTQGSSAFRLVFLPQGSTCVFVGSPTGNGTKWVSFYELDRWFPLTYVHFERYEVDANDTSAYEVKRMPGHWQPRDPAEAREWWLYNANVRLRLDRLKLMLDPVLKGE